MRQFRDSTLLDVTAMSAALIQNAELDRTASDIANLRSEAFEHEVQALIDDSPWSASGLRALRGRVLRLQSKGITNIDAIGAKADCLLLVSCKSLIYDRSYDRGDYRVVRNVQSTTDSAVIDWNEKIALLRKHSVGDNYDFSRFKRFLGVVCTPFEVYSDAPETLAFADGSLRRCASAAELNDWLHA